MEVKGEKVGCVSFGAPDGRSGTTGGSLFCF